MEWGLGKPSVIGNQCQGPLYVARAQMKCDGWSQCVWMKALKCAIVHLIKQFPVKASSAPHNQTHAHFIDEAL